MDFPADIILRKTRMKFELTFKVVLLFSYQGFVCSFFATQLLYFISFRSFCQELFFILLFLSFENSLYILSFSFENVKYFFVINNHNGEEGIWTLAPLLTTYSLSRRAPSASWVLLQIVNKTYSKRMYKPMTSYLNRWYGEGGIRTHGTFQYHWFSRPAP